MAFAQVKIERSVTVSSSSKKDGEIKKLLLHTAILESIRESSQVLGIDSEAFQKKLEAKFTLFFEDWKERRLKENFGKNYAAELGEERKKAFLDGLEQNRSQEFIKFARLSRLTDSYAFKKIENSKTDPNEWKGEVVLNLSKGRLEKFYQRLESDENKHYERIVILPEINLLGSSWKELGVENAESFTTPLLNSWSTWLINNQPSNVEEILRCEGACVGEFSEWLQISQDEGMQIPEKLRNSLWLKILFNVRKVSFTPDIKEWSFEWDGSMVLLDSNTKLLLSSRTIPVRKKTWRGLEQKELNSALASLMYKSALDSLVKMTKKIEDSSRFNRLARLVISGHQNLGDVIFLMEMLRREGEKLYLELKLDSFNQKEASLLGFYQGEEKSFTDLLSGVKEIKSSQSFRLVSEFTGIHHEIKLVGE